MGSKRSVDDDAMMLQFLRAYTETRARMLGQGHGHRFCSQHELDTSLQGQLCHRPAGSCASVLAHCLGLRVHGLLVPLCFPRLALLSAFLASVMGSGLTRGRLILISEGCIHILNPKP